LQATQIVRKGEVGQNFSGKKDVYERYLLGTDLANQSIRRYATGASTLGVLHSVLFFGQCQYISAWAIELLILMQGNARARTWDERSRAPTSFRLILLTAESG